jgi:oligopeptide transport system permease protein
MFIASLLRRVIQAIPSLLALVTMTFFMLHAAPGGPFDSEAGLTAQTRAQLEAAYQLDQPLLHQFGHYLVSLLRGDLGPSYQYPDRSVNELIASAWPVSATLGSLAIILGLSSGLALGIAAARRPGSLCDHTVSAFALLALSIPNFVVAPLLVLVFAVALGWLPAGGLNSGVMSWILPVAALALPHVAVVARLSRSTLIDVLRSPYVLTARAKGLSEMVIVVRHALKPTLLPVISYLGPAAAATLTGSVVIEQIFGLPGIGRFFVLGAFNRDYGLVMGVVLLYGSLIIAFNLLVDLLYARLDPRLR